MQDIMTMTQHGDEGNVTAAFILIKRSLYQEATSLFAHCG